MVAGTVEKKAFGLCQVDGNLEPELRVKKRCTEGKLILVFRLYCSWEKSH